MCSIHYELTIWTKGKQKMFNQISCKKDWRTCNPELFEPGPLLHALLLHALTRSREILPPIFSAIQKGFDSATGKACNDADFRRSTSCDWPFCNRIYYEIKDSV